MPSVLLLLAFVLIAAKLACELVERLGQPAVLGELTVGILLGNLPLLGGTDLSGLAHGETFTVLAELGAIVLLIQVGLESTPREMLAVGGRAMLVALVGVVAPMLLGFGVGERARPGSQLVLQGRPVVDAGTYAAAVFMVVATTMATPPLLLWSMRRSAARVAAAPEKEAS